MNWDRSWPTSNARRRRRNVFRKQSASTPAMWRATSVLDSCSRARAGCRKQRSNIRPGFMQQSAGRMSEAAVQYQAAARLQPEGPAAYFSQAFGFANERRSADAVKLFQAAVWMNPRFWQARYLLGVELALAEHVEEAEAQFAEVVRLRPD